MPQRRADTRPSPGTARPSNPATDCRAGRNRRKHTWPRGFLTLRDVNGDDCAVPLGRLGADGRVPLPEAHSHWQPGGPVGRAGSARLHRQPSPSWLRSAGRVAGAQRDPLDRQHEEPAVSTGNERPAVKAGSWAKPPLRTPQRPGAWTGSPSVASTPAACRCYDVAGRRRRRDPSRLPSTLA